MRNNGEQMCWGDGGGRGYPSDHTTETDLSQDGVITGSVIIYAHIEQIYSAKVDAISLKAQDSLDLLSKC